MTRALLLSLLLCACGGESVEPDGGLDAGLVDAASRDAAMSDAATSDSGDLDGGPTPDAAVPDGGGVVACSSDCSSQGECVEVDGVPTCACNSGYYRRGLSCLRDPCESEGTCYYVDSLRGNDSNTGTRDAPWLSIGRVETALASLAAGDFVLFRRDGRWTDEGSLDLRRLEGMEEAPITFGAYGDGERPLLSAIRVDLSSHVTVRDFDHSSGTGPCTNVTRSGYVILQDLEAHECSNNGLHVGRGSHHSVLIDNLVWDVGANDALVIHESSSPTEAEQVGDHHWIVDNIVPRNIAEQPVDIATGSDTFEGAEDLKIVGNLLAGGGNGCIAIGHGSSRAWIVGNTMGACTRSETAFSIGMAGQHGIYSGTDYRVVGNIVFNTLMSFVQFGGEEPVVPAAWVHHNSFVSASAVRAGARNRTASTIEFHHNLVLPGLNQAHVGFRDSGDLSASDDNWFVPNGVDECRIQGQTLSEWQSASGRDGRSQCAAIAWLDEPTSASAGGADTWREAAFLANFTPDATWAGCDDGIGAIACDGRRHIEFEPFESLAENDGYGWRGPLIVRQRYPLRP